MKRTALAAPRIQRVPRAARKSEWLRSALAHYHSPDPGVENEIVVLATGIDQYLQEVFHHLAYTNENDTVSAEDFTALCAVLGLTGVEKRTMEITQGRGEREKNEEDREFRDVCFGLPCRLSFKDFHSRLCGYFRVRTAHRGTGAAAWRLPVSEDTELVERQIQLRWPRVRRRMCVRFDLAKDQGAAVNKSINGEAKGDRETDEVLALRELVEDLRSALQGSDARCLSLEVALRRERSRSLPPASSVSSSVSSATTSIIFRQGKLVPTHSIKGQCSRAGAQRAERRQDMRDPLLRELKLIRSSRDGQLEEAMKFNEQLEEEVQWAYQEVRKLQRVEAALRKENAHIRRRAEEAREALTMGLQRVRMIQEQAQSVPQLQARIAQLETRSCCTCIPDPTRPLISPVGAVDTWSTTADAECLQRAVEGKAASDEEEEEQCCQLEVKNHTGRLHGCGTGCQNHVAHRHHVNDKCFINPSKDNGSGCCSWRSPNQEQEKGTRLKKEKRHEEEEYKRRQMQEKLTDALTVLLQLRSKNVSRSALAEMVMDSLDVCSGTVPSAPSQVPQAADALCSDLLGASEQEEGRDQLLTPSSGHEPSSIKPLLISC